MVITTLISLKFYLIALPYLFFWINFIITLLELVYYKISRKSTVVYFPEETDYHLINFICIYPRRIGFSTIYYFPLRNLIKLKNLTHLVRIFLIVIIVGIPFIFINFAKIYLKKRNIVNTWDEISPYKNIKLIFNDGKIIRNMKKIAKNLIEFKHKAGPIDGGLIMTEKGTHAVGIDRISGIGVTYTSKLQKSEEGLKVRSAEMFGKNSYGYAQKFESNKIISEDEIKNKELYYLIKERKLFDTAKANLIISETNQTHIRMNKENKQSLIIISNKIKEASEEAVNRYGGREFTNKIIEEADLYETFHTKRKEAEVILLKMMNESKEERSKIFEKKKSEIKILEELTKNKKLDNEDKKVIEKIIEKIYEITK